LTRMARDFLVNEALLTDESYPSEKHPSVDGVTSPEISKATNAAFLLRSVISGAAQPLICATGSATQLGERPFLESYLFVLVLAVGLTPELLPMILSGTLARSVMRAPVMRAQ